MRPNIVSEAGLQTRIFVWWEGIPFLTSAVVVTCGIIYLVCLLVGYDSFLQVCFLPSAVVSHFQVYRIFTSIFFHGSLLHVMFNMLALVPLGSELERIMGSVRLSYMLILLATTNAILHLLIALLVAHNPFHADPNFMNECSIGFSGILFSMIVIETNLSGIHSRSVFGLFNVPAKWYAWILLVVFQLLMTNVSLLGHLCGILSGFTYIKGFFNFVLPGTSFYSAIEASSLLSSCIRRPKFILCTGCNPSAHIPTHSSQNAAASGLTFGNIWRSLSSWMPQREMAAESTQGSQIFPGRGRMLGSIRSQQTVPNVNPDLGLQARLLDSNNPEHTTETVRITGLQGADGRQSSVEGSAAVVGGSPNNQGLIASEEEVHRIVSMGFEQTQVEVALAAADGDLNVAVEILMRQQA